MAKPERRFDIKKWLIGSSSLGAAGLALFKRHELVDWVRDNPFWGVVAPAGTAAVVLLVAFLKKVWGRLWTAEVEESATKATADWVLSAVSTALSRFRRRYAEEVCYRHRWFNVRGLRTQGMHKLELEQLFIELRVVPQEFKKASTDPLRPGALTRPWGVWQLLASRQEAFRCLAVVGAPGSGKTTLLQHVALSLAQNRQRRHERRCPAFVPIFLALKDHKDTLWKKDPPDLDRLATEVFTTERLKPPPDWFARHLKSGHCLVLLDGLDEVADERRRKKIAEWVDRQVERYPKARFIITSRPHGYQSTPLKSASVFEVQPFTPDQVRRFVEGWYLQNEVMSTGKDDPGVRAEATERCSDLLRRLKTTPALARLSVNPLLLTMVAMVHRYRGTLPRRRVELYAEICDVLLGHWQAAKGLDDRLTPAQKRQVLQPLALEMMAREVRELTEADAARVILPVLKQIDPSGALAPADFLKRIEQGSGLLLERESGVYGFAHLTFQEYLVACHFLRTQQERDLLNHIVDPWWRETTRLYVAQCDAAPVLRACLELAEASKDPEETVRALTLAYDCQDEALKIDDPDLRERLQRLILDGLESDQPERRRLAADVLFSIRQGNFVRLDEEREIDTNYVSCAEYQTFLDDMTAQKKSHHPLHWPTNQFPKGAALKPIAGVRFEDAAAFCQWINSRARARGETGIHYRLPTPDEASDNLLAPLNANPLFEDLHGDDVGCWCDDVIPTRIGVARDLEIMQREIIRRQAIHDATIIEYMKELRYGRLGGDNDVGYGIARARPLASALIGSLKHFENHDIIPLVSGMVLSATFRAKHVLSRVRIHLSADGETRFSIDRLRGFALRNGLALATLMDRGSRSASQSSRSFHGNSVGATLGPEAEDLGLSRDYEPRRAESRYFASTDLEVIRSACKSPLIEYADMLSLSSGPAARGKPLSEDERFSSVAEAFGIDCLTLAFSEQDEQLREIYMEYARAFCLYTAAAVVVVNDGRRQPGTWWSRFRERLYSWRVIRVETLDVRERMLPAYMVLTVLAERRAGRLPALESIRLVREVESEASTANKPSGRQPFAKQAVRVRFEMGLEFLASEIVCRLARLFPCEIKIRHADRDGPEMVVDAKSILDLTLLSAEQGTTLIIEASGERAKEAVKTLASVFLYESLEAYRASPDS